jgi:hypothetical protein
MPAERKLYHNGSTETFRVSRYSKLPPSTTFVFYDDPCAGQLNSGPRGTVELALSLILSPFGSAFE